MPHWRNVGRPKKKSGKLPGVFAIGDRVCLPDGNGCCLHAGTSGEVISIDEDGVYVRGDENGAEELCSIVALRHEE